MQFTSGTERYNNIPLVVNGLDQVLACVKDSKASVKSLPPKSESQDPPQAKDDLFDRDGADMNDTNTRVLPRHATSRSLSKEPSERMPYCIANHDHSRNRQSSHNELNSLISFDSDDLPEIALDNEHQLADSRHDYQHHQVIHKQDHDSYKQRRGEPSVYYRVPHRGEMGGHRYRELVVDVPKDSYQHEQKPIDRLLPSTATQLHSMHPPTSKARIPSMPPPTVTTETIDLGRKTLSMVREVGSGLISINRMPLTRYCLC